MSDRDEQIDMRLSGTGDRPERVSLRTFAKASETLAELLMLVGRRLHPGVRVEWGVAALQPGSVIVPITGTTMTRHNTGVPGQVIRSTMEAVDVLEQRQQTAPWMTYAIVDKVHSLSSLSARGELSLIGQHREVRVTPAAARAAKALTDRRYVSYGSVEGTIETVSVHEARYFTVFEIADGYAIKCRCTDELLEEAKMALGQRVRVSGRLERRFDGRVDAIDLERIVPFRPDHELPTVQDMIGIFADDTADAIREKH